MVVAGALLAVAVVGIVLTRLLSRRGFAVALGGSPDLSRVVRRGDAVVLVVDLAANTMYYVPLVNRGGVYTFSTASGSGIFVPVSNNVLNCMGKPCFVGLRWKNIVVELPAKTTSMLNAMSLKDESKKVVKYTSQDVLRSIEEYIRDLTYEISQRTGQLTVSTDVVVDAYPPYAIAEVVKFLADASESNIKMIELLVSQAEEIGKRLEAGRRIADWGMLAVYMGIALGVVFILLAVSRLITP
jgi:hypothetical protein